MSQGVQNTALLMALTFATFTLGAMGWYGAVGVGFDTGLMEESKSVTNDINNPSAQASGTTNIGFFGIAIGVVNTFKALGMLNVELYGILTSLTVPPPIALPIQLMYNFVFGLTMLSILRGFNII